MLEIFETQKLTTASLSYVSLFKSLQKNSKSFQLAFQLAISGRDISNILRHRSLSLTTSILRERTRRRGTRFTSRRREPRLANGQTRTDDGAAVKRPERGEKKNDKKRTRDSERGAELRGVRQCEWSLVQRYTGARYSECYFESGGRECRRVRGVAGQ